MGRDVVRLTLPGDECVEGAAGGEVIYREARERRERQTDACKVRGDVRQRIVRL